MPRNDNRQLITKQLGSYRQTLPIALPNALAANSELVALQWTQATNLLLLTNIKTAIKQSNVAASAETLCDIRCFRATAFTVADSVGTAVTPQKKQSSMPASLVADFRFGAPLTVGTRTLDPQPFMGMSYELSTGVLTAVDYPTWSEQWNDPAMGAVMPLVLAQNEGIVVRSTTAHPATGAATLYVTLEWDEVTDLN